VEVLGVKADPPQAIEEVPVWVLDGSEPYFLEPKLVKTFYSLANGSNPAKIFG
jgi:hypothetical protein